MIVSFPDLYPDELFYSACARYGQRMQYPSDAVLRTELFGSKSFSVAINLPIHLDAFTARLQPEHHLTQDIIIDDHTMMPFFSPFVPKHRVALARASMRGSGRSHPGMFLHTLPAGTVALQRLRFCIECVVEDRQRFGETYWHRIHQTPGVFVCPTHMILLTQSNVRFHSVDITTKFVPAELAVFITPPELPQLLYTKKHLLLLLNIAKDSQWLLNNRPNFARETLSQHYSTLLADRGLACYSGRLRTGSLIESFIAFFSQDLLRVLGCEIDTSRPKNWLSTMMRVSHKDHVRHPLHYLLMIHFLGYTLEAFLLYQPQPKPFGNGPWICHNPFCHDYLKPSITHVQIIFRNQQSEVVGFFACECGFVYSRRGPDCTSDDQHRIGKIVTYGSLWESEFQRMLSEKGPSRGEIVHVLSQQMGIHPSGIYKHARRLGLRGTVVLRENLHHVEINPPKMNDKTFLEKRDSHREIWLETLQQYPDASMTLLGNQCPESYSWLSRNDYEWKRQHSVPSQRGKHKKVKREIKDWEKIDIKLVEDVLQAATRIKIKNPPIQVSYRALFREMGKTNRIRAIPQELLLTKNAIQVSIENYTEFLIRKMEYIQKLYMDEGIVPTKIEFKLRAGLHYTNYKTLVDNFIDEALRTLKKTI